MSDLSKRNREIMRLEERKNVLENSYGAGSFRDGLVRQQVEDIDRQIAAARKVG